MPANRNALIRYKTIDKCLQNRYRKWTLDDLIEACSEALYEYEGLDTGVSRRTVQADIQIMRSDKLGYNAPIVVKQKKFYSYDDPEYSITNIPLTDQDLGMLTEAVDFMKQFKGFSHFQELDAMVQKLEDHIYSQKTKTRSVIDFEKNENLRGLRFLDELYKAIIKKQTLEIDYQSFKAKQEQTFMFYPYLLKEFRNRWFLVGNEENRSNVMLLALDRMKAVRISTLPFQENPEFDPDTFFKDAIGVSVTPHDRIEEVELWLSPKHAPYALTKPFHHSQETIKEGENGTIVRLRVQHNFELEKDLLAFGEGVKVIKPDRLRRRVKQRMAHAIDLYETDLNTERIQSALRKFQFQGYCIINSIYTLRERRKMSGILNNYSQQNEESFYSKRRLLMDIPSLQEVLFNENLKAVIEKIDPEAFLVKAIYFDKPPRANWVVPWHQDIPINVKERVETEGYSKWVFRQGIHSVTPSPEINQSTFTIRIHLDDTVEENGALQVIPGSQKKRFSEKEVRLLIENSTPASCFVEAGGIHIMRPLLLHASRRTSNKGQRRVIHLEFSSCELANGLEWLEKETVF